MQFINTIHYFFLFYFLFFFFLEYIGKFFVHYWEILNFLEKEVYFRKKNGPLYLSFHQSACMKKMRRKKEEEEGAKKKKKKKKTTTTKNKKTTTIQQYSSCVMVEHQTPN